MRMLTRRPGLGYQHPLNEPGCPIHSTRTAVLARLRLRDGRRLGSGAPANVRGSLT